MIQGWIFSARICSYRVNIGSFNRSFLYEGHFNPEMLHIGFFLHSRNSSMVLAHNYDTDSISVDLGTVPVHGILAANTVWANISAPEQVIMTGVQYSRKEMQASRLQCALHNLLSTSFNAEVYEQSFAKSDMFRMSLLEKLHKLSRRYRTQPLSLKEICNGVELKQRTLQKYFHELLRYGTHRRFLCVTIERRSH